MPEPAPLPESVTVPESVAVPESGTVPESVTVPESAVGVGAPMLPGNDSAVALDGPAMVRQPSGPAPTPSGGEVASVASMPPHAESLSTEVVHEETSDDDESPTQPPLLTVRPFRYLALGLLAAALLLQFVHPVAAAGVAGAGCVALIAWSMIAVVNAHRARPATTHGRAPRASTLLCAWLIAPVLAVPGVLGLMQLRDAVDAASEVDRDAATLTLSAAVFGFVVVGLIVVYLPYAKLGVASKWIGADATKFRRWFYGPLVTVLLTLTGLVLYGLSGDENVADAPGADALFAGVNSDGYGLILLIALPSVVWLLMGFRAMVDIEEATAHQHRRRRDDEPKASVTAYLAAQGVPAAATATESD